MFFFIPPNYTFAILTNASGCLYVHDIVNIFQTCRHFLYSHIKHTHQFTFQQYILYYFYLVCAVYCRIVFNSSLRTFRLCRLLLLLTRIKTTGTSSGRHPFTVLLKPSGGSPNEANEELLHL